MTDILPNPAGAGYFDLASYGGVDISAVILSSSAALPLGTLVEVVTPYTGPGTANPPTVVNVQASATTVDNKLVGVIVGGRPINAGTGAGSFGGGTVVRIRMIGVAQVLCSATTTAGSTLIQSTTQTGAAVTGTAVTGQTVGIALQALTISSGVSLVWALLKPS